jgi:hypothetical protein
LPERQRVSPFIIQQLYKMTAVKFIAQKTQCRTAERIFTIILSCSELAFSRRELIICLFVKESVWSEKSKISLSCVFKACDNFINVLSVGFSFPLSMLLRYLGLIPNIFMVKSYELSKFIYSKKRALTAQALTLRKKY